METIVKGLEVGLTSMLILLFLSMPTDQALASAVDELVAKAKRESSINIHAPTTLGVSGARELASIFNKKYGLNIKLNYFPSGGYTKDTAKVMSQSAMGVPPEWDLMVLTENFHADLSRKGLLFPYNYKSLGIDPQAIHHNNGSITLSHAIVLPAYNATLLPLKDVPATWEDLLDPKWKGGKLGVADSTFYFTLLAAGPWGEERTTAFVKELAKQRPILGRLAELYTRLQLGEILVAAMMWEGFIHRARNTGAPIVFADRLEPVLVTTTNVGVLKGAAHPNAAHLFSAFLLSPEAQQVLEKYIGQTSAFTPGTPTQRFLDGKQAVFMGGQDPNFVESLSREYSTILGFTR